MASCTTAAPGIGKTDSTRAFLGEILIARLDSHTAEIEAIGKRMAAAGPLLHLTLVILVVLMIWKPGA